MQRVIVTIITTSMLLFLTSCSREHYRESADTEVYAAIAQKSPSVPNMDPNFLLTESPTLEFSKYPVNKDESEFFGNEKNIEVGCHIISLDDVLKIAVRHNRQFKNEKESLYLEALSLTLSRHRYTPIFSAGGGVNYQKERTTEEISEGIDKIVTHHQTDINGRASVDNLLRTGGRIAANFTTDFFRYLAGDGRLATSSALTGTFIQPLLRGAGYKVAMENLTQAERDLLYSLRNFTRFRQEFTVSVVTDYYKVLQDRDRVRNSWQAYQNFQENVKRETARYKEGLARKADLAELQESELTNEQAWINAFSNYRENLDRFKITLGLPTDTRIILDDKELDHMTIDETHLSLNLKEAIEVALASRLDLKTVSDQVADAERKVELAYNGCMPELNMNVGAKIGSRQGANLRNWDFDKYTWNAGLDVDFPIDRKSERNAYRAALIQHDRTRRALDNYEDQIRLDVQNGWRNLQQAKRDYDISRVRVNLSRSRLREQKLLSEIGEGDAFDLVRAQDALTSSQNEWTSALINHTIIRLNFWRDLGLLCVTSDGKWNLEYNNHVKNL